MTEMSMSVAELIEKGSDSDVLREMIQFVCQRMMEYDVEGRCNAAHGERKPGDAWLVNRKVDARLQIPTVPCQTVLDSIPPEFVPSMQGFELKGQFATDLVLELDWKNLEAARLDGSVGIRGCKVVDVPPEMEVKRLLEACWMFRDVRFGAFEQVEAIHDLFEGEKLDGDEDE